jgi:hypothetical protein
MLGNLIKAFGVMKSDQPLVEFKVAVLEKAMPAKSAVVFGDMWRVDGFYTRKTLDFGCQRAVLIDGLETVTWLKTRLRYPQIDFYKGDFSNSLFMRSIQERFEIGVAFDILLHQPPLLNTIHLMTEKVERRFCIVQPMLREQEFPNSLIYLPGNTDELYPIARKHGDFKMFDVSQVNQSHWIWGITQTFLQAVFLGEGFELVYQEELAPLANEHWFWGGYIFEKRGGNPSHWSASKVTPGLYKADW